MNASPVSPAQAAVILGITGAFVFLARSLTFDLPTLGGALVTLVGGTWLAMSRGGLS